LSLPYPPVSALPPFLEWFQQVSFLHLHTSSEEPIIKFHSV
jgi:hypothetical protein